MASLSSVVNSRSGDTDLTALAATDWYALDTGATVCRKNGGGSLITLNISGSGGTNSGINGSNTITFSDGTPTASVSASAYGWYDYGTTTIVVPASTTTDTCNLYIDDSNNAAGVNWSAHLSDSSAGDISGTYTKGVHTHVFTFAAGSAGQTLTITISNGNNYNVFSAVALSQNTGGGGTVYTRTLSESITVVDSPVRGVSDFRRIAESVALADVVSRLAKLYRQSPEIIAVADVALRGIMRNRLLTDTLSVAETMARNLIAGRVITDGVTANDAAIRNALLNRLISDGIDINDSLASTITYYANLIGFVLMGLETLEHILMRPTDLEPIAMRSERLEQIIAELTDNTVDMGAEKLEQILMELTDER